MDFDLNEEQRLLRDLVDRWSIDRYDPVRRLAYVREPAGFSEAGWRDLAATGLLAAPFGAEFGGLGGDPRILIVLAEAMGRSVMTEPLLPVLLLAGRTIERAGSPEQRDEWIPRIIAGERFAALAHYEQAGRFQDDAVAARVAGNGGAVLIEGAKQLVMGGPHADAFIVSARQADGATGLYLVAADADRLERRDYRLIDGSVASDLILRQVEAISMPGGAQAVQATLTEARLAICAELVGLMSRLLDDTLEHVKTRNQFGQSIGQFQTVQHRLADDYARLELSRSQLYRAAGADAAAQAEAIAGAKAFIADNALALGEDAVQLHGGIGTTEELMVGQAFKRVMLLARLFGDCAWDLKRYVRMSSGRTN